MSELEQSQRDAIGLGLVAAGAFFSFVFYFGWEGGKVGEGLAEALIFFLGKVAYLVPLGLLGAGAALVFWQVLPSTPPLKAGAILVLLALTLAFAAGTLGLGTNVPRHALFETSHLKSHGGLVGALLYALFSTFFQRIGAHIAALFMLASGVLLLTGASVAAMAQITSGAFRHATRRARQRTHEFVRVLAEERDRAREGAATAAGRAMYPEQMAEAHGVSVEEELSSVEAGEEDADDYEYDDETSGEPHSAPALRRVEEEDLTPQGARRSAVTEAGPISYRLPDPGLLRRSGKGGRPDTSNQEQVAKLLVETLGHFGIEARVVGQVTGPRVTRHELSLAPGTKVSKVAQLKDDLAYALASTDIRILAPIPGKQAVGVEVPNLSHRMVFLGDIFKRKISDRRQADGRASGGMADGTSPLTVWLGKDISGNSVWTDLARMPHLLVAGTTGSGKSGCVNAMLSSILLRSTPNEVRMVLVDPKRVELNYYDEIPHLLTPVVTVPRQAANVLANLIREMESRYEVMGHARARNIVEMNRARAASGEPPLPYILCVIDELADLMMVAPSEVEDSIIRLAQKSRAVGIHLVLATQRPSVDVITGTIKVNVPARVSFAVSSQHDSRVILDQGGAEALLGQGDMLFRPVGSSKLQRIQGAYITEDEIARLVDAWRGQGQPEYASEMLEGPDRDEGSEHELSPDEDDLLEEAITLVAQTQTASVSMLQRRLRVGYTRAGRLIDMLERRGVISGYEGSKPRQVLISEGELPSLLSQDNERDARPAVAVAPGSSLEPELEDDSENSF
jgi:S-DNA-T family DNA segregation ATPase FtsK/SpoIIIE